MVPTWETSQLRKYKCWRLLYHAMYSIMQHVPHADLGILCGERRVFLVLLCCISFIRFLTEWFLTYSLSLSQVLYSISIHYASPLYGIPSRQPDGIIQLCLYIKFWSAVYCVHNFVRLLTPLFEWNLVYSAADCISNCKTCTDATTCESDGCEDGYDDQGDSNPTVICMGKLACFHTLSVADSCLRRTASCWKCVWGGVL